MINWTALQLRENFAENSVYDSYRNADTIYGYGESIDGEYLHPYTQHSSYLSSASPLFRASSGSNNNPINVLEPSNEISFSILNINVRPFEVRKYKRRIIQNTSENISNTRRRRRKRKKNVLTLPKKKHSYNYKNIRLHKQ